MPLPTATGVLNQESVGNRSFGFNGTKIQDHGGDHNHRIGDKRRALNAVETIQKENQCAGGQQSFYVVLHAGTNPEIFPNGLQLLAWVKWVKT